MALIPFAGVILWLIIVKYSLRSMPSFVHSWLCSYLSYIDVKWTHLNPQEYKIFKNLLYINCNQNRCFCIQLTGLFQVVLTRAMISQVPDRLDTLTSNIMVFGHNKLCQLPIVNSLPVIIKVLWPLATTNCDSCRKQMITNVVTTIWPQIVR